MTSLLFALAVLAATSVWIFRKARTWFATQEARKAPGATIENPICVGSFDAIEETIEARVCGACGGRLINLGESSAREGEQLFRVVRLECGDCEERGWIHFNVTQAYQ